MEKWLESVHSSGTAEFISNPLPKLFETVKVRIRMYKDAPVKHVFLLSFPNGIERFDEMHAVKNEHGLVYYEAELKMVENRISYQFYLVCDDVIYFYTQRGITTYVPDRAYDFVLMAGYEQPDWVKKAVFYQIFPERFCNGDESNDVQSGEYSQEGFPTIKIPNWNSVPLDYNKGHCLDFYGGDLQGIIQKIPYLKELGVTALYLNPVFKAPSVHKYDCLDYFHVDPHFGGDETLAKLCSALHENGMKIVLDISINHTGTDHKWFNRDGIWFDKTTGAYNNPESKERSYYFFDKNNGYKCWFDVETMPTLNYTSDALRETIYRAEDSVIKKWLKPPYCIDGWRFDVADVFARNNEIQLDMELWPEIRKSIKAVNPNAYILAEDWGDCPEHMQGDQWDSPMNYYACGRVIRSFLGEPDLFMNRNPILRSVPYKMTAKDLENRVMNYLAKIPYALWENQFNLFDSHDVSRLHNNPKVHPEEYRGAVIFQFLLTGAPSIYYGDEAAADGTIDTIEGCRYPMPWDKNFKETENYKLYHTLANLKHEHKALSEGGMKFLFAEGRVFAIARFFENEVFVGIISVEDKDVKIRLPLGAVGADLPKREIFGRPIEFTKTDKNSIEFTAKAHNAYFFECEML